MLKIPEQLKKLDLPHSLTRWRYTLPTLVEMEDGFSLFEDKFCKIPCNVIYMGPKAVRLGAVACEEPVVWMMTEKFCEVDYINISQSLDWAKARPTGKVAGISNFNTGRDVGILIADDVVSKLREFVGKLSI